MASTIPLTDIRIRTLKQDPDKPKKRLYGDGGGLYLIHHKGGSKSWIYRYRKQGRQFDVNLGGYPAITLANARNLASVARSAKAMGNDIRSSLYPPKSKSFKEVCDLFLIDKKSENPSPVVLKEWIRLIDVVSEPLHNIEVQNLTTEDFVGVLRPIWHKTPVAAKKAQQRLERILNYATANNWRDGPNPAAWKANLQDVLPRQKHVPKHHPALSEHETQILTAWLRKKGGSSDKVLEFLVLTVCRSGEVLNAQIEEFDLENAVWTIPSNRMKNRKDHQVPLSDRALAIVKDAIGDRSSGFVFPGSIPGRPFANTTLSKRLKALGPANANSTLHGFRSVFRDWAEERDTSAWRIAEHALSHTVGGPLERAYRRKTSLDDRRKLMQDWADFCSG